jgi:hypothetical protein
MKKRFVIGLTTMLLLGFIDLSAVASNPSDTHPSSITIQVVNNLGLPMYYDSVNSVYDPSLQSGITAVNPYSNVASDVAVLPGQSWNVTLTSLIVSSSAVPVYSAKVTFYAPMNDGKPGCTFSIYCNHISTNGNSAYCSNISVGAVASTTPSLNLSCKANAPVAGSGLNLQGSTSFEINGAADSAKK